MMENMSDKNKISTMSDNRLRYFLGKRRGSNFYIECEIIIHKSYIGSNWFIIG